ncbi:MAG TPA: patatin-like phospholipase family protein [Xanthobacteraceae bacterium]|jgi:NTE family protein|nr:patatin-like phospholipase family protein [Xanthobacteraceae bacterium]
MFRVWCQRAIRVGGVLAIAALLSSCTSAIHNDPVNQQLTANARQVEADLTPDVPGGSDDMVVALSFSGGGTRAAAFSYGVLQGFENTSVPTRSGPVALIDRLDFLSGVSGGSTLAAYYGLHGHSGYADFKQRFLLANAEEGLQTNLTLGNIARGLNGGVNDATQFPPWLDAHLYNHATFRDLLKRQRPRVWINASDVYNRTAFIFAPVSFSALCSDLTSYPVSLAVAASAAVPVVFAPIVIKNFPGGCPIGLPPWVTRVHNDPNAKPLIKSYADALERYRSGEIKYVKLLDGGLIDNYGLAGFTVARLASDSPFGPLAPQEAARLRRFLFLVVDSGRDPSGQWSQTVAGPSGVDLIMATSDTATESGALGSYSAFDSTMADWRNDLIRWRCSLSEGERKRLGTPPGWNCHDVQFFISKIAFDSLGPQRTAALNRVETRFALPPDQVEMLITAGRDALNVNPKFRAFLSSVGRMPPPVPPVAPSLPLPPANAPVSSIDNIQQARAN